jgi:hypothetical protein
LKRRLCLRRRGLSFQAGDRQSSISSSKKRDCPLFCSPQEKGDCPFFIPFLLKGCVSWLGGRGLFRGQP